MKFRIYDRGGTVKSGTLEPVQTEHGHKIHEQKDYFNHPPGFEKPVVQFDGGPRLELKRTATGFSSATVRGGIKYGCNLNRIKNRPGRYGVTAWYETLEEMKGGGQ